MNGIKIFLWAESTPVFIFSTLLFLALNIEAVENICLLKFIDEDDE